MSSDDPFLRRGPGDEGARPVAGVGAGGVEALLTARLATLGRFVAAVADEGAMRRRLSTAVLEALAEEARAVQGDLWLIPDGMTSARRQDLETRLTRLAAAERDEAVTLWRDLTVVSREHRTWLKEYLDLQQRTTLVLQSSPLAAKEPR